MENKHKKRKAFIIAIIAIIILLLTLFLVYKYRDSFGVKTSSNITKIFSPLISSINQKGFLGQKNIPPTVMKSVAGDEVLGVANEDILYQETGKITTKIDPVGNILLVIGGENIKNGDSVSLLKASNPFWKSFVGLFSKKKVVQDNSCTNDTDNFPLCTTKNGACINDATNPPLCNDGGNGGTGVGGTGGDGTGGFQYLPQCADTKDNNDNGLIDELDPNCHVGGVLTGKYVPGHYSESSFPVSYLPVCMDKKDNDKDGLIDEFDPECHVGGTLDGEYVPGHYSESASPFQYLPACMDTKDNDSDGLIDELDPNCHIGGVLTGDYVPSHYSESSSPIVAWNEGIDLTASEITPTSAKSNIKVTLSSTITNNGNKSTEKSFITLFTITTNTASAIVNAGDINLTATTPTLSAETQSVASVSHTFTSSGVYYVRACADKKAVGDAGTITEYNENNNCGEWTTITIDSSLPQGGDVCTNGATNPTLCTIGPDGTCLNGATNPPECTTFECTNGATNPPECTALPDSNICLGIEQNPLTFTDIEKAKLADLLRKFYLIAPTMKTVDDIGLVYSEIIQQQNFSEQLDGLIKECYLETSDPRYTGPEVRFGNPWYKYDTRGSYLYANDINRPSYCWKDPNVATPRYALSASSCPTRSSNKLECEKYLGKDYLGGLGVLTAGVSVILGSQEYLDTGCTWVENIDLAEYEKLLNVW